MPGTMDLQGGLDDDELADVRRRAVPAIAAYRDGGCVPHELPEDVVVEMMAFLAGTPLDEDVMVPMFVEDMQFDGADSGAIAWGDEVSDEAKAASPVVVIGCGLSGILAGIRLTQAGLPFVIVEKDEGPGGTWWENRYPGARVDVGSHHYCYSFEPSHHWTEYYCQQPELRDYFVRVLDKYELRPHCRFGTEVTSLTWDEPTSSWQVGIRNPDGTTEVLEARFVISAVGSLNIPRMPDIPGMDDVHRAVVPLGPLARRPRPHREAVRARRRRRARVPDRADHRRHRRAAHDLPAHDAVDAAEPAVPRAGAAR